MSLWIVAVILGIVEGLTEFLPVSSTGHMILAAELMGVQDTWKQINTFEVVIQLGSIMAVVVVFWRRLWAVVGVRTGEYKNKQGQLNLMHVIVGCIPAIIAGLLFDDLIDEHLFSYQTVIVALIAGGILMLIAEKVAAKNNHLSESLDKLSYRQAFYIGCFQLIALWPGFSRSGSTMSGGLIVGVGRKTAAEFSFIIAVPMMIGATGLKVFKALDTMSMSDVPVFIVGAIVAFIVAMIAIVFFLKLISKVTLKGFAYYRFAIALVFIAYMIWR
ncbi:undecaprenyl-diphosphate phosphatase [Brochothrix campestris]|uniref:Undecaprenyl-diphosphatase n=1 Tax=Brochothrix campestris FSL F6-1037 TaxID=1265861 RepID=W7CN05_9LIST|nr:undecaprenyl-diphosphate phosphatase [Brochothrix campestris]EUJ38060.1 undecaprenyl pyrophosphate phosphatase [Brochothrix campestris FSL F6-1037]